MQANQLNVVHESEAQRRHSRLNIPGVLKINVNKDPKQFELLDLSASGFSVNDAAGELKQDGLIPGKISFNLDGVEFVIDVEFRAVGQGSKSSARVGCEFVDLGVKEISILRLIITKFLSGEIVAVNDVLATLSRDNFAKQRKVNPNQALPLTGKIKAVAGTSFVFLLGVVAFLFILSNVYKNFFLANAIAAAVSIPSSSAIASREGFVAPLVKLGEKVSVGQAIATIDSPLFEMMAPLASEAGLTEGELRDALSKRVSGVIESPCECVVVENLYEQGKYVQKGDESGLKLAAINALPEITALFESDDLASLQSGAEVNIKFGHGAEDKAGVISHVQLQRALSDSGANNGVLVTIEPKEALPLDMLNRPVEVDLELFFR